MGEGGAARHPGNPPFFPESIAISLIWTFITIRWDVVTTASQPASLGPRSNLPHTERVSQPETPPNSLRHSSPGLPVTLRTRCSHLPSPRGPVRLAPHPPTGPPPLALPAQCLNHASSVPPPGFCTCCSHCAEGRIASPKIQSQVQTARYL